ncbi:DNA-directed_RNA polymerase III subunit 22.9 kDa polypeptide [Hexamita inflata]|uniref:DNA-directed RNA polymerase III subunit 22.9 kDa polypeptide n=1 Tax=Hexamita inflata TaxID=28002 RepID=A0AA86TTI4_9EUKA|nr:DNA-directed RNA polymerase III subunit 22.9 kDa polypeptide [Hexamita inflata]
MFIELDVTDTVYVAPRHLTQDQNQVIIQQINNTQIGKHVKNCGIFVQAVKILEVMDKEVQQQDPTVHFRCNFRAIFFRPFRNEIIQGQIHTQTPKGILVCLKFFNDVFIPSSFLPQNSNFDTLENVWTWQYEDTQFFFDPLDQVRVRVVDIAERVGGQEFTGEDYVEWMANNSCFMIIGAMNESGLGSVRWWC